MMEGISFFHGIPHRLKLDYIKRNLKVNIDENTIKGEITRIVKEIPKEEFRKTFEKLIERMKLCIKNNGEYFEHLIK